MLEMEDEVVIVKGPEENGVGLFVEWWRGRVGWLVGHLTPSLTSMMLLANASSSGVMALNSPAMS